LIDKSDQKIIEDLQKQLLEYEEKIDEAKGDLTATDAADDWWLDWYRTKLMTYVSNRDAIKEKLDRIYEKHD